MLVLGPDMRAADSPPDPYAAIRQRFLQVIEGHSFEVSGWGLLPDGAKSYAKPIKRAFRGP